MNPEGTRNMLFVAGCPRSGTTALWKLLVSHPAIVLGVERYVLLAYANKLSPKLFAKEKFFSLRPGETFYDSLEGFSPYYAQAKLAYDGARWIGDKLPNLYLSYPALAAKFASVHVIYILRNIIDVAGSYQKRAEDVGDTTWQKKRDYAVAVEDWNQSLRATLGQLTGNSGHVVFHIVCYEELFLSRANIQPIFDLLGLNAADGAREAYNALSAIAPRLEKNRGDSLNSMQRHYIACNADFDSYRALHRRRLVLEPELSLASGDKGAAEFAKGGKL